MTDVIPQALIDRALAQEREAHAVGDTDAARMRPTIRHHTGLASWDLDVAVVVANGHIVAAMRNGEPGTLWVARGTPAWHASPAVFGEVFHYQRLSNA